MVKHDLLSDMFSIITHAEEVGKEECVVPLSKLIKSVLEVMKTAGYIKDFQVVEDGKGGYIQVSLSGTLNKAAVVKPRFAVKIGEFDKWEGRYLPSMNVGILIISTPKGVINHTQAKKAKTGGRLLGYVY